MFFNYIYNKINNKLTDVFSMIYYHYYKKRMNRITINKRKHIDLDNDNNDKQFKKIKNN